MRKDNPYSSPDNTPAPEPEPRVYRDAEDELLDNSIAVRILGVIAIAIGCFVGHTGVYVPLTQALSGRQSLYLHSGAVGTTVAAVVGGLVMLIAGRHTRKVLMHRWYNAAPLNVAGTFVIVALAIAADIGFKHLLIALGYAFTH